MATRTKKQIKGMKAKVCDKCSCELPAQSFKTKTLKDSKFCTHCRSLTRFGKKFYNQLVQLQRKACAICLTKCDNLRIDLNSDEEVRGLLCLDCEVALAEMKQSPVTVAAALHYLEKDMNTKPVRTVQIIVSPGNDVLISYAGFSFWELNAALYRAIEQLEEQQLILSHQMMMHEEENDEEEEE